MKVTDVANTANIALLSAETAAPASEKETSMLDVAKETAGAVKEQFGGGFFKEYMEKATEIEAEIDAAQEERRKNGQTANKATEIFERLKRTPRMLAFVLPKVVKVIGAVIAA